MLRIGRVFSGLEKYIHNYSNFYGADGAIAAVWVVVETLEIEMKEAKIRYFFFVSVPSPPRVSVLPYKNRSFLQPSFLCSSIFHIHDDTFLLFLQDTAFAIPF